MLSVTLNHLLNILLFRTVFFYFEHIALDQLRLLLQYIFLSIMYTFPFEWWKSILL